MRIFYFSRENTWEQMEFLAKSLEYIFAYFLITVSHNSFGAFCKVHRSHIKKYIPTIQELYKIFDGC